MTVREITEKILTESGAPRLSYSETADRLVAGSWDQTVTKIATTFMATAEVIRQANENGVDMIITHEPTFYTGTDDLSWVERDPVYLAKKKMIDESKIAIWRFHDHMHMGTEDGIYRGFEIDTGWKQYRVSGSEGMERFGQNYDLPEMNLVERAKSLKDTFAMDVIQLVGNPDSISKRVSVLVGGGSLGLGIEYMPMKIIADNQIDTVICGDITEWTLPAYVRDASQLGMDLGMIILGHERSEECGMKHLTEWLAGFLPEIPCQFIDAKEPFFYE